MDDAEKKYSNGRVVALAVALIVTLGAVLRFTALDVSPAGLWYDEALNGENAMSILAGERPIFFYPDGYPQEPLFFYLQAAALKVFSGGRPAVWPLRATAAAVGTATLLVFWLFASTVLPRRWALAALFVMAVFPWHFHFSRLGFRTILTPLFVCAIGWSLATWLQTRRTWAAAALGALTGASLYSYTAANVLPICVLFSIVVAVYCANGIKSTDDEGDAKRGSGTAMGAIVAAAAFAIVFAPLALYYLQHGARVLDRVRQVGPGAGTFTLGDNAARLFYFFFGLTGDPVFKHGPLGRPALPLVCAAFFVAGGAWMLAQFRARRGLAIYCWLVLLGFVASSLLSESAPNKLRTLGCVPVVVLFFVQGLRLAALGLRSFDVPAWVVRFGVGVVLALWLWGEASPIALDWHRNPQIYGQFSGQFTQAARWARGEPLPAADGSGAAAERRFDLPLYLPTAIADHATVRYLTAGMPGIRRLESLSDALTPKPGESNQIYLLITSNAPDNLQILRQLAVDPVPIAVLVNHVSGEPWGMFVVANRRQSALVDDEAGLAASYLTDR